MGKYSSLAADIIKNVGGKENVESLRHCVTRLRFRLIDESIANDEVIKKYGRRGDRDESHGRIHGSHRGARGGCIR